mmetsp:Transcript_16515/g.46591  ORF Transcript_16515/g.46591 Transcript_16515/m.46591 type:complete len:204 (+) Transcript_16515:1100-1711(+)
MPGQPSSRGRCHSHREPLPLTCPPGWPRSPCWRPARTAAHGQIVCSDRGLPGQESAPLRARPAVSIGRAAGARFSARPAVGAGPAVRLSKADLAGETTPPCDTPHAPSSTPRSGSAPRTPRRGLLRPSIWRVSGSGLLRAAGGVSRCAWARLGTGPWRHWEQTGCACPSGMTTSRRSSWVGRAADSRSTPKAIGQFMWAPMAS